MEMTEKILVVDDMEVGLNWIILHLQPITVQNMYWLQQESFVSYAGFI